MMCGVVATTTIRLRSGENNLAAVAAAEAEIRVRLNIG